MYLITVIAMNRNIFAHLESIQFNISAITIHINLIFICILHVKLSDCFNHSWYLQMFLIIPFDIYSFYCCYFFLKSWISYENNNLISLFYLLLCKYYLWWTYKIWNNYLKIPLQKEEKSYIIIRFTKIKQKYWKRSK